MSRMLFALLLGMVVTSCASLGMRTEGVSGPIAWRATDLKIQAVGEAAGVIGRPVQQEVYSFTLVLQETQGTVLTFTKVAYRIEPGRITEAKRSASSSTSSYPIILTR